eukprot:313413-Pleurochrysis_carterae.AAC.2
MRDASLVKAHAGCHSGMGRYTERGASLASSLTSRKHPSSLVNLVPLVTRGGEACSESVVQDLKDAVSERAGISKEAVTQARTDPEEGEADFPLLTKALGLRASRAALAVFLCSPLSPALCAPLARSLLTATLRVVRKRAKVGEDSARKWEKIPRE